MGGHSFVVTGDAAGAVDVWRADTGALVRRLGVVPDAVWSLSAGRCGDRRLVVAGDAVGAVHVWDVHSGSRVHQLLTHGGRAAVAIGGPPQGAMIAAGTVGGGPSPLFLWDAVSGRPLRELPIRRRPGGFGTQAGINAVAFGGEPSATFLAAAVEDGTVRIWPTHRRWRLLGTGGRLHTAHERMAWSVAIGCIPAGTVVVSGGSEGRLVVDPLDGKGKGYQVNQNATSDWARSVAVATIGTDTLIAIARDHHAPAIPETFSSIALLDAASGQYLHQLAPTAPVGINVTRFGRFSRVDAVLAGCADGTLLAWDARTAKPLPALRASDAPLSALAVL